MKRAPNRNLLLGLLVLVLTFNYVDRLALGLVLQNVKADLGLSDTQLGLLTGIAFALFYSTMGIPIARWADRGNRVLIITLTTAAWSLAVALCGLAQTFIQLMAIRVVVAIGEAGCIPTAHSLIASYFTRTERPRAVATYMLGGPLASVIGYFLAGWLNQLYGWRVTFIALGLPGVFVAILVWTMLSDPVRRGPARAADRKDRAQARREDGKAAEIVSLPIVCRTLWASRTFRHMLLYFSVASFFNAGIAVWKPAFFIRSFGFETGELGTWMALIYGVGSIIGIYLGGEWASRRASNRPDAQLRVMAWMVASFSAVSVAMYLSPDPYLALALLAIATLGAGTTTGPVFAALQSLVPASMRATSIAFIYLVANLIGMGLGPLAAGALSEGLQPRFGDESLRYALLLLCPGYLWAAWHLWRASAFIVRETASSTAEE